MLRPLFAAMMRRIHVSDDDLTLIEEACRRLANRYRLESERHVNPLTKAGALESAAKFERIAERMKRFREPA